MPAWLAGRAIWRRSAGIGNAPVKCTLVPVDVLRLGGADEDIDEDETAEMETA